MLACTESKFSNFKFEYFREIELLSKSLHPTVYNKLFGLIFNSWHRLPEKDGNILVLYSGKFLDNCIISIYFCSVVEYAYLLLHDLQHMSGKKTEIYMYIRVGQLLYL